MIRPGWDKKYWLQSLITEKSTRWTGVFRECLKDWLAKNPLSSSVSVQFFLLKPLCPPLLTYLERGDNCQEMELVQKMSFKDLEKEIMRVKGLRTKFCFDQQLKLEKRILEVASTWWYWVSIVWLWLALGGTGSVRSVLTACVIYAFWKYMIS